MFVECYNNETIFDLAESETLTKMFYSYFSTTKISHKDLRGERKLEREGSRWFKILKQGQTSKRRRANR